MFGVVRERLATIQMKRIAVTRVGLFLVQQILFCSVYTLNAPVIFVLGQAVAAAGSLYACNAAGGARVSDSHRPTRGGIGMGLHFCKGLPRTHILVERCNRLQVSPGIWQCPTDGTWRCRFPGRTD